MGDIENAKHGKDTVASNEDDNDEEEEPTHGAEEERDHQARNLRFYVLMFFGSLYLMAIVTQWDTKATETAGGVSDAVVAANLCAHWGVVLLYFVTLVAPMACPGRFAYDEDSE